jgi:hypothetical protein
MIAQQPHASADGQVAAWTRMYEAGTLPKEAYLAMVTAWATAQARASFEHGQQQQGAAAAAPAAVVQAAQNSPAPRPSDIAPPSANVAPGLRGPGEEPPEEVGESSAKENDDNVAPPTSSVKVEPGLRGPEEELPEEVDGSSTEEEDDDDEWQPSCRGCGGSRTPSRTTSKRGRARQPGSAPSQ